MPTYTVLAPAGQLSTSQKRTIANDITHTHTRITGAPWFFAQVVFMDIALDDWFVGGVPLQSNQFYIHGHIRAGRSAQDKRELVVALRDALARGAAVPVTQVWCYVAELPSDQMVEYGHVLPEPGGETAWLAQLPREDRDLMESVGRQRPGAN